MFLLPCKDSKRVTRPFVFADIFLPLCSLRLLIPPLRLLSAAMWQVAQRREVLEYEKLDEFVTLVTATVPDLLSPKQRGKLLLRLRAKVSQRVSCEIKLHNVLNVCTIMLHGVSV